MNATITQLRPDTRNCTQPGANPEAWFPHEPKLEETAVRDGVEVDARAAYEENARQLCDGCPLAAACLEGALADEAQYGVKAHGIFGGLAPWERQAMARNTQRRAYAMTVRDDRRRTA